MATSPILTLPDHPQVTQPILHFTRIALAPPTRHYVFSDDVDVLLPIRPRVLMPEADDMAEFVDNYTKLVAILADRDCL